MRAFRFALGLLLALAALPASAQLRGHGGPARAVAATADGRLAISGGFDSTAIVWALAENRALGVLRLHDDAVTAVAALPDGRFASGGADGRVALWRLGARTPESVAQAHGAQVSAFAVAPDGTRLASASWDRSVRLVDPASGVETRIAGHRDVINAIAFTRDGATLVSGAHDGEVRLTALSGGEAQSVAAGGPVAALALLDDGRIALARGDGEILALDPATRGFAPLARLPAPATALAATAGRLAAAAADGSILMIDPVSGRARPLAAKQGAPVWGLAFAGDELLAAGHDGFVRRYDVATGAERAPAAFAERPEIAPDLRDHPGARVFSACIACHAVQPEEGRRAGPNLHGLFGRRIATAPGYDFSPALKAMSIVWTPETVSKLFEIGPTRYTPGTKMPEQRVVNDADRAALIDFLQRATR